MPRLSRFDEERINKLFGRKNKLIKKTFEEKKPSTLDTSQTPRNNKSFKTSNYITL